MFCSGLLYHLGGADGCAFVKSMAEVCDNLLIIDTHVGLGPKTTAAWNGKTYYGTTCWEHSPKDSEAVKRSRPWSSLDNNTSFWITEPSLVNLLRDVGFTSVTKVLSPQSFSQTSDRVTFAAIKGGPQRIILSPELANTPDADFPEEISKPHPYQSSGTAWGHFLMRVKRRLARAIRAAPELSHVTSRKNNSLTACPSSGADRVLDNVKDRARMDAVSFKNGMTEIFDSQLRNGKARLLQAENKVGLSVHSDMIFLAIMLPTIGFGNVRGVFKGFFHGQNKGNHCDAETSGAQYSEQFPHCPAVVFNMFQNMRA